MTDHYDFSGRLLDEPDDEIPMVAQTEYVHDGVTRTRTSYWYDRDTAIADLVARLAANPQGRWGYVHEPGERFLYRVHRRQCIAKATGEAPR